MRDEKFEAIGPVCVEMVPTVMELAVTPGALLVAAPADPPIATMPVANATAATAATVALATIPDTAPRCFFCVRMASPRCPARRIPPGCRSLSCSAILLTDSLFVASLHVATRSPSTWMTELPGLDPFQPPPDPDNSVRLASSWTPGYYHFRGIACARSPRARVSASRSAKTAGS